MGQKMTKTLSLGCILVLMVSFPALARMEPVRLRCEYRENPLGIDSLPPRLSWVLDSDQRGQYQSAYQILVATGKEKLKKEKADLWDSGKVESSQTLHVIYQGRKLTSQQRCYWQMRVWDKDGKISSWSNPAWWETALLDSNDWDGYWINDGKAPSSREQDFYRDDPAPLFRKEFTVSKSVRSARLYISGLGYYEAHLNGKRIGANVLDPGWTSYAQQVLYSCYDITPLLREGKNAMGVMLGNGWYNPLPLRMWGRLNLREHLTVGRPRFIAQLNIEFTDGTHQSVVTDKNWKVQDGPVLRNSIYLGEVYDARKEVPGWNQPDIDDHTWRACIPTQEPLGKLRAQQQEPIRITRTLKPVKITEPQPGVFIFDMGQNFAGWVRLRVQGQAGTKVTLRYGELLHPDGALNVMTSACGQIKPGRAQGGPGAPELACQTDVYILKGKGEEVYTPRFTFHGFRYVELTGFPGTPNLDTLEGLRLNAAVADAGAFACSNKMFNRIQKMTRWTFLSNLFSVQSDCPHREKFGYGGDIVPTSEAFLFNFDMANFYAKVVQDFADATRPNDGLTETAPFVGIADGGLGGGSGPIGWGTAQPYLMEKLYQFYGNQRILEKHYETTRQWVRFLRNHAPNHIIDKGIGDHESIDPKPVALTSTAFYYHNVKILARLAQLTGRDEEAESYRKLAEQIRQAFIEKFLQPGTGRFDIGTQTCQTCALYYELVPAAEKQAAFAALLEQIQEKHKNHLATGIFGTKFLFDVLQQHGRTDVAYSIVNQKTFPGWGYMLKNNATTLWEQWAFSDDTFSHNHPMFGSVSTWFYASLAGIQPHPEAAGFDRIIIRPQIVSDLKWVKGTYNSVRGMIKSAWRIDGDILLLNVTIPVNTTATVYVPAFDVENITESGHPIKDVPGVIFQGTDRNAVVFKVTSGEYTFQSRKFSFPPHQP